MKMVKSLLLGTAAGLVAVAGAQAADMPVKAKPVLYVKICTLYGDGFYYIPGTDICLKLGGYVRSQHYYNYGNNATNTPFFGTNVLEHAHRSADQLDTQGALAHLGRYPSADRVRHAADLLHSRPHLRLYCDCGFGTGNLRQPRLHPVRRVHARLGVVVLRLLLLADRELLRRQLGRHR